MTTPFTAYFDGRWVPQDQICIAVDDFGFFQGATAVERLRTWGLQLPPLQSHLDRFANSTTELRIVGLPNNDAIRQLVESLIARNAPSVDVGITLFATPGRRGQKQPTFCAHLTNLNASRISRLQESGQALVVTTIQQPSPDCWSRGIKVRSRLHYYLADLQANDHIQDGLGVLLDTDGTITETSTSNIILCNGKSLTMPPEDRVLPGVMAKVVCAIAGENGYRINRRPIGAGELVEAQEVWLTGSEIGLWYANQIDDHPKHKPVECFAIQKLLHRRLQGI